MKTKKTRQKRIAQPYNTMGINGIYYWDYSIRLAGVVWETSVNQTTGKMYFYKDPDNQVRRQ